MITINTITNPINKIPSVEPISDTPSANNVGVVCTDMEAVLKLCDAETGWLNTAITSAATSMMNRDAIQITCFVFIVLLDVIVSCIESILFNPFMYFSILSMYNPPSY